MPSVTATRAALVWFVAMPLQAFAGITYYHTDLLGSPIMATNEQAEVVWRSLYQPFGAQFQSLGDQAASYANPLGFTGHMDDAETGLIYMQARYYDPGVGRFLRVDPKAVEPEIPASFNRYSYANNNPYKFVDPDGKDAIVFNVSVQGKMLENIVQDVLGTDIRISGASVGIGFSLADSNSNGIPEADIGIVGTLDINGSAIAGGRVNIGIQRSLNKDPSLADLAGFGAGFAVSGLGIGGKLMVGENGVVLLEGQAGAVLPGASAAGHGTGICSLRSGCRGWYSSSEPEPVPQVLDGSDGQPGGADRLRNDNFERSGWF